MINIPSPKELFQEDISTPASDYLVTNLLKLLRVRYCGRPVQLTLVEIKAGDYLGKIESYDWDKMELAMERAGWKMVFDKPGYNESYAANYTVSSQ